MDPIYLRHLNQLVDFDLPDDVRLFTGFVFPHSRPHRHKSSKWFVGLDEYPFDFWPPYVTAGAYVLSREALVDMYFTSYYTKVTNPAVKFFTFLSRCSSCQSPRWPRTSPPLELHTRQCWCCRTGSCSHTCMSCKEGVVHCKVLCCHHIHC